MIELQWSSDLESGIKDIDNQHKELIELINSAHKLTEKNEVKKIEALITKLLDYSRYHFSTEEKYFIEYNYPEAEEHKFEHAKLIEKTISKYEQVKNNQETTRSFFAFLKTWWEHHLKFDDKKYRDYFKKIRAKEI